MKRFIDTRNTGICANFAFFDTVRNVFEKLEDTSAWVNWAEFRQDYLHSGGAELERYERLCPEWVKFVTLEDTDDEFYIYIET